MMRDNVSNQKIGVIIPFYNGDEFILKCLSSLRDVRLVENFTLQIFIVDNNKIQSSHEEEIRQGENISYLKTMPAIGYGRACNLGSHKAIAIGCNYLCLLNQDTLVDEYMFIRLLNVLIKEKGFLVCSPMIFEYDFNHPMEMVVVNYLLKNRSLMKDLFSDKVKTFYEIPTVGAACIIMHKKVVSKIGLFDPLFFHYGEDYDFFKRLERTEGKLLIIPAAKLAHWASMNETNINQRWKNKELYEEAQLIEFIRYKKQRGYLKKTVKTAWIFLRNNQLNLFGKYLNKALKIYLNSDEYRLPSDEIIKERIAKYQKKDVIR